jgi:hypothetical protein
MSEKDRRERSRSRERERPWREGGGGRGGRGGGGGFGGRLISDTGFWLIDNAKMNVHHAFDEGLCAELLKLFSEVAPQDSIIIDVGCGRCDYINYLWDSDRYVAGVDGNPATIKLSEHAMVHDLSTPLPSSFPKSMTVMSLEVGEHLPKVHEKVFLDNVTSRVIPGGTLVLSWAKPGQGGLGHVNEQPNSYIIDRVVERGFVHLPAESTRLRKVSRLWWFKDTIMVFQRSLVNKALTITPSAVGASTSPASVTDGASTTVASVAVGTSTTSASVLDDASITSDDGAPKMLSESVSKVK